MSTPDTTTETPAPGRTAKYRASANAIWYDDMVLARLSGFADTDEAAAEMVHRANTQTALMEACKASDDLIRLLQNGYVFEKSELAGVLKIVSTAIADATKGAL